MNSTYNKMAIVVIALWLSLTGNSYASEWAYLTETYYLTGHNERLSATLTKRGKEEWELVNCMTVRTGKIMCIYKRPVQ